MNLAFDKSLAFKLRAIKHICLVEGHVPSNVCLALVNILC